MPENTNLNRRRVLEAVGAGVGTAGVAGAASAQNSDRGGFVVGLEPGVDISVATGPALDVSRSLDFGDIGAAVAADYDEATLDSLRNDRRVRYVERDKPVQLHEVTDRDVGTQAEDIPYGIEITDATQSIENGSTGDGVTVAVVDTGIEASHEDLEANVVGGYAVAECDEDCESPWDDDQGHGTHVAGTVAAAYNNNVGVTGVAPEANLLGVKVFAGTTGSSSDIADGIEWAANNGAQVINLSLGASTESSIITDAVEYADSLGIVVVSSAGNDGPCDDCVGYPAALPESIAVSASDDQDNLAFFSSTGPEVDITAPGAAVESTYPDNSYESLSGTSMSSPHVAGAAAAAIQEGVDPSQIRPVLQDSADDVGLGPNEQGAGRLNVLDATDGSSDPGQIAVVSGAADSIGETSATLTGNVDYLESLDDADVMFEYGPVGAGFPNMVDAGTAGEGEQFSAEVSGLEPGTSYEFIAVGVAGGETSEGDPASFQTDDSGGGFCFITTATADDTETLDSLRRFRDESMKTTPVGRGLVGLYYRISPPIARTLDRHPDSTETGLTRRLIDACASLSDSQANTDSRVRSAALGAALTMLYMVGIVVGVAGHASLRTRETLGLAR